MRKLKKWNRELPMAKDENGRSIAPKFQLHHFSEKCGLPADLYKKAPASFRLRRTGARTVMTSQMA